MSDRQSKSLAAIELTAHNEMHSSQVAVVDRLVGHNIMIGYQNVVVYVDPKVPATELWLPSVGKSSAPPVVATEV